ncbi:adenosylcobinamide-phosphate synthase [Anaerosporomusa subterranea]|uniref:Cobalamin biosynthesis protein CobD n=1 Tax=Anaerosporomusa subterranea TaxID=1794912 RepID=A0A154BSC0_ANASB|nr:adenosylcobinamide-phosphate synthase CbiB [Anaerosporomusa subterranea]KYZ76720.1 adenosylcobinamide-phosphate synthase [Anaerosporomusa subterranea]
MIIGVQALIPLFAVLIDTVVGDPRSKWHPVVLIGNLIATLERVLRKPDASVQRQHWAGAILVCLVLGMVYSVVKDLLYILELLHPLAGFTGGAVLLSFAITPRSLAEAGCEIKDYLLAGDLVQARAKVGWIVGRDTDSLDEASATRATVETVAENIVDGIVSPLFYAAIGGVPLAFLYRAVNTLDSMVGYKNEKYLHFGMVAARVDDVFNYIPARLTGLLVIIAAALLRYDAKGAMKTILRDAAKHPSPNSGIPEAAVAGALGIRLGGLNYYGGVASFRSYMGEPHKPLVAQHIQQTTQLMALVTSLTVVVVVLLGEWLWA